MSLKAILDQVNKFRARHVTVTGGEPLAQAGCVELLTLLLDRGYYVGLETSGALDVSQVDPSVNKVLDLKTPSSGEVQANRWQNLKHLTRNDEVKVVIGNREDYEWARQQVVSRNLIERCPVFFSPITGRQSARELAEWILEDGLEVRFQLQIHKLLWDDARGR